MNKNILKIIEVDRDRTNPLLLVYAFLTLVITIFPLIRLLLFLQDKQKVDQFLSIIIRQWQYLYNYNWSWNALAAIGQIVGALGTIVTAYLAFKTIQKSTEVAHLPFTTNLVVNKHIDIEQDVITVYATNNRNIPIHIIEANIIICEILSPSFYDIIFNRPLTKIVATPEINSPFSININPPTIIQFGNSVTMEFKYSFSHDYNRNTGKDFSEFEIYFYFINSEHKIFWEAAYVSLYKNRITIY